MEWLWLILIGIIGGILGGMGMGGGTLLIQLLTIFLLIKQNIAQGINLLAFLPMSIVVLIIHFKNKLVDIKSSWAIIVLGVISAIGGALFAGTVEPKNLKVYFAIFLIILGIFQFISIFIFKQNESQNNSRMLMVIENKIADTNILSYEQTLLLKQTKQLNEIEQTKEIRQTKEMKQSKKLKRTKDKNKHKKLFI